MTTPTGESITPLKGRDLLVKALSATSPSGYQTITGARATSVKINGNPVDISSKTSAGWQELFAAGIRSVELSLSGLVDDTNPRVYTLQDAALAGGTILPLEVIYGNSVGKGLIGNFSVADFTLDGPHDNATTFSTTIRSSGPVTYGVVS